MLNTNGLNDILRFIKKFGEDHEEILAIGLCGSWARGTAGPDSDIDLSIIVMDRFRFKQTDWIEALDFAAINDELDYFSDKTYGRVWSRHVFLKSKTEIEFSFANRSWADHKDPDEGTIKVVSDGYQIIYDPEEILKKLLDAVSC